jgi:hypothetical protein
LHIQLEDADGEGDVQMVVEVPVNHDNADSPWSDIRTTVFSWTKTQFPFTTKSGRKLKLKQNPVIAVVGKAFFDAKHTGHIPNRRNDDLKVTVWEIHPVMKLEVLKENADNE